MKRKWIFLAICIFVMTACSPSEQAIATAIAQTQTAQPTATFSPTPRPTDTPIPTVTSTVAASPSPTPDLRVIQLEPKEFLFQKNELPPEGKYFLPGSGWTSPSHNQEVVAQRTVEEGRKYLQETGRIDGWWVAYKRGTNGVNMPEEVYNAVIEFETAEGAQVLLNKYLIQDLEEDGYIELENAPEIGDATRIFIKKEMQSGGDNRVWFILSFTYMNYYNEIELWGWESDIAQEFAQALSELQLTKLQEVPLVPP
jgi:hypothetical protein